MHFRLLCQQYIELIRAESMDSAFQYAQQELNSAVRGNETFRQMLQNIFPLIAYKDPQKSPLSHYLSDEHRQQVADSLNAAILRTSFQILDFFS